MPVDSVDALVQSFLKECKRSGVAALVAYGLTTNGKPVLRIAANTEQAAASGLWNWLTKLDERAVVAAAKQLAFLVATGAAPPKDDKLKFETPDELWPMLSEEMRLTFLQQAQAVIAAAKNQQGRSLNIVDADGKVTPS